jgi:hypothetical protein
VNEIGVRRIDGSFQGLEPVAGLNSLGHEAVILWNTVPLQIRQRRRRALIAHVGPDHAVVLDARVGPRPHLALKVAFGRFGRHVGTGTLHVELPAVVYAAKTFFLVPPKEHRCTTVRTSILDHANVAGGGPKRN